jgi:hypothetical protein
LIALSAGAELVLVENGESRMPIVVFADAPPFTRRAADELAEYIEKVSGARPEVLEGQPDPLPDSAIWVGYQPVLDGIFPELDFDFQHPEEILIAANDDQLVIAGRDRWDPDHLEVQLGRRTINGVQQEYGTVNAVYTFLQDYLDVRWLWPGELGEDIRHVDTLSFDPFRYRYHPQFRARAGVFIIYMLNRKHPGYEWARFQRAQLDSLDISGGHGFTDWWQRFYKDHPEYFALQPDGSRGTWPGPLTGFRPGIYVKTCKNNPGVWTQWLNDVETQLEKNPNQQVFNAAANDGAYEGYCICERCRSWDNPDAPRMLFRWRGLAKEYVSMSDRHVTFANHLGRMLKQRYPDKDYYVSILAYGNSTLPPVAAVPDDNVLVASVHSFHRSRAIHPRTGIDQRKAFLAYANVTDRLIWRPNIGQGSGWHIGKPNVAPRRAIEDFRLVADKNVMGLWFDAIYGHWANQGLHYYILAQLAWNPRADGKAIVDDYLRRAYGPAVEPMRAYWDRFEQATEALTLEEKPAPEVWDAAFHQRANQYLDRATAKLDGAPAKYARRVAFARAGLEYLRLLQENEVLVERWNQSGKTDTEARDAALANWEQIEKLSVEHPFMVNPNYVNRKNHKRMGRFLPLP